MTPQPKQRPAHHHDPDMADALLLAMLDNPDQAEAIAGLSDEELDAVAADTPLDDEPADDDDDAISE